MHYALKNRLLPFVQSADADGLIRLLGSLSRSEQRMADVMLGEQLLAQCDADVYWHLTLALARHDSRAWLITLMKTFLCRMKHGTAGLYDASFLALAGGFNDIERRKVAMLILPELTTPEDVRQLFCALGVAQGREQLPYLMQFDTLPCLFLTLCNLRFVEADRQQLVRVARSLMRRGSGRSFSLASIIKVAFGLDEITGTFSLHLQPFQIARLERSYQAFCQSVG